MATQKRAAMIAPQIIIKPPLRKTSDVAQWRTALLSADMGRMKLLYDLYEDLLIDGVLSDSVDKRVNAVTNSPLVFLDNDGQEVPEIMEMIDSTDFEDLLKTIMEAQFWGRSGGEFSFVNGWMEFTKIPPKHIKLENHQILRNEYDDTGFDYLNDDFLLVLGKPREFGIFLKTAPYAIWKRGGFGDYAQWIELFGMPQRIGKYSSADSQTRQLLEYALEKAGSAPWAVIPKEADIETVNNTGTGASSTAHNDFRKACNEEMLITVLGQTMTTLDGSSLSQSKIHKQVEEGKNRADLRYTRRVLNWMVLPLLEKRGYPVKGGKFVFPEDTEPLKVADIVSLSKIVTMPVSFIRNKYGIPEPQEGEEIAGETENPTNTPQKLDENGNKIEEPIENADRNLFIRLFDFFAAAPASGAAKESFFANWKQRLTGNIRLSDDYTINFEKLFQQALKEIYGGDTSLVNTSLFDITNNAVQHAFTLEFSAEGDDWGKGNADFIQKFRQSGAEFSAFKAHTLTKEFIQQVYDAQGNQKPFKQYKADCLALKEQDIRHLRTQYNTAIKTSRAAINYRRYLATKHVYPNLEYMESRAKRKRADHLEYVGTILPIEHPWWLTHMPPGDWNCQCWVKPTNKKPTAVPTEETVDPVFANNPGQSGKFINYEATPYYTNTDEKLRMAIIALAVALEALRVEQENKEA